VLECIGTLEAVSGTQTLFGNWIIFALRYKNGDEPTQISTIERHPDVFLIIIIYDI
jgi:hypothetical protein